MILVTGGAGFIGANFVHDWLAGCDEPVLTLDAFTYAGNADNLPPALLGPRHTLVRGDICDADLLRALLQAHRPRAIVHFAAESHVDRSIHGPEAFVRTNVQGTFRLLEAARAHWAGLDAAGQQAFRFLHVSTDEVYGSLGPADPAFTETSRYCPSSPYSASKAASDHLVHAWFRTYGLPTLITNCSNNYGPRQFPEKLIPLTIANLLANQPVRLYGDGRNVRDWLYVGDHCSAIRAVLARGRPGEVYNIGGGCERTNLEVVQALCRRFDELVPDAAGPHERLITYVADRQGHDWRYAVDARKIRQELGWAPQMSFEQGVHATVDWYLAHQGWVRRVQNGDYARWIDTQYAQRAVQPPPAEAR